MDEIIPEKQAEQSRQAGVELRYAKSSFYKGGFFVWKILALLVCEGKIRRKK